jgi:subtilisin family serine protease
MKPAFLPALSLVAFAASAMALRAQDRPEPKAAPARAARSVTKVVGGWDLSRVHRPGRIAYRLMPGAPESTPQQLQAKVGALSGKEIWKGLLHMMELPPEADLAVALRALDADPRVAYAQPSYLYHADGVPDDPSFSSQWSLDQSNDADIDAPEAWDTATDATGTIVAVIDTGVQYDHPDLAANMWTNTAELNGTTGVDDDNNGYTDDIYGIDTVNDDSDPMDDHFHGTHCSGIIGAVGDNATGITGVCWQARIMAIKFLSAGGSGDTVDAIEGLEYAVDMGAQVSSNSWGGYGTDQALYDAIQAAGDSHHLFVCAAGNNSIDIEGQDWLPGGFDLDNVVDVAATNSSDGLAWFSNWGPVSVDLGAPGDSIYSTWLGSTYGYASGTSMACPHVSGVATMLFGQSGTTHEELVKSWILDSVDPLAALSGLCVTGGRLNFDGALAEMQADAASWANYGTGLAGTNGIPTLTSNADPEIGTTISLLVSNSKGANTQGLLILGTSQASIPYRGGTILVGDIFSTVVISIPMAGASIDLDVPDDTDLLGAHAYVQVLEVDSGAPKKYSMTPGLDLTIGS